MYFSFADYKGENENRSPINHLEVITLRSKVSSPYRNVSLVGGSPPEILTPVCPNCPRSDDRSTSRGYGRLFFVLRLEAEVLGKRKEVMPLSQWQARSWVLCVRIYGSFATSFNL